MKCNKWWLIVLGYIFFLSGGEVWALPAFPGAVGFGSQTIGGRGGRVIEVTNLNDSGGGSLRAAIEATGPRIVVFRVSGTIELKKHLIVDNPYIYIAGQTSSGGIQLKGGGVKIRQAHDVIVRGLMIRPGNGDIGAPLTDRSGIVVQNDATSAQPYNLVFDHNSIEWTTDESANVWGPPSAHEITFSNNIFAQALNCSGRADNTINCKPWSSSHTAVDGHPYGPLVGRGSKNITFYANLIANNSWRNPKMDINTSTEVINNVVYSWGTGGIVVQGSGEGPSYTNILGNYTKATACSNSKGVLIDSASSGSKVYLDDWANTTGSTFLINSIKSTTPAFTGSGITPLSTSNSYDYVLMNAGALRGDRVDNLVKTNVRNGTLPNNKCYIDTPSEVGGWPNYSGTPIIDNDHDGMLDSWEDARGGDLKPEVVTTSGYSWIEEYVNSFFPTSKATVTPALVLLTSTSTPTPTPTLVSPANVSTNGKTYYVSPTGSDTNNGQSATSPIKTIQKAINSVSAGDTIQVRAGIYTENLVINKSGTSTKPITLTTYPNEKVTINGGTGYSIKDSGSSSFWIIDGFTITTTGTKSTAILVTSSEWAGSTPTHWIIRNNTMLGGGVLLRGSYNLVENNTINGRHQPKDGNAWQSGIRDSWGGGTTAKGNASPTHHNIYRGNTIFGFSRSGIWSMGYTHDQIIENNTIYDIYDTGNLDAGQCINLDGAGTVEWRNVVRGNHISDCASVAIALENVFDSLIENNDIKDGFRGITLINYGSVGCTVGGENNQYGDTNGDDDCRAEITNNIVRQNIVVNSKSDAIRDFGGSGNHFLNNSTYGTNATLTFGQTDYLSHSDVIGNIITNANSLPSQLRTRTNNITPLGVYKNPPTDLSPIGVAVDKITKIDAYQNSVTGSWILDIAGKPRLAGVSNDIGAYEHGSTQVSPTLVPTITQAQDNCTSLRLGGDADCNGVVDIDDYSLWYKQFYDGESGEVIRTDWEADFTGLGGKPDGRVDIYDYSFWHVRFYSSI